MDIIIRRWLMARRPRAALEMLAAVPVASAVVVRVVVLAAPMAVAVAAADKTLPVAQVALMVAAAAPRVYPTQVMLMQQLPAAHMAALVVEELTEQQVHPKALTR